MTRQIELSTGRKNLEFVERACASHETLIEALQAVLYTIKALDEDYFERSSYLAGIKALKRAGVKL